MRHNLCNGTVDALRPQTAAKGEDTHPIPHPQLFPGGSAVSKEDLLPHRAAGDNGLLAALQMSSCLGHCQQHLVSGFGDEPGGHTRIGVGFMGDGAKSHLCCLAQHRTADIAAGSHHHIGLELLKDAACSAPTGAEQLHRGEVVAEIAPGKPPLDALELHRCKVIPGFRHQTGLHPLGTADKQHLGIGIPASDVIGGGQSRIDVSGCAAAGKENFHGSFVLRLGLSGHG